MSRMSTLLYLEDSPKDLRGLEIQIDKALRPFLTESGWKRKSSRFNFGWMFDWLDFPSSATSVFATFEGPSGLDVTPGGGKWRNFTKEQKKLVPIDEVLKICKFETYLETGDLSGEILDEIVEDGYIIFPDGSQYVNGKFSFNEKSSQLASKLLAIASAEALRKLLQRPGASLLLCTFHERP